jgi:hypothetical protein
MTIKHQLRVLSRVVLGDTRPTIARRVNTNRPESSPTSAGRTDLGLIEPGPESNADTITGARNSPKMNGEVYFRME